MLPNPKCKRVPKCGVINPGTCCFDWVGGVVVGVESEPRAQPLSHLVWRTIEGPLQMSAYIADVPTGHVIVINGQPVFVPKQEGNKA